MRARRPPPSRQRRFTWLGTPTVGLVAAGAVMAACSDGARWSRLTAERPAEVASSARAGASGDAVDGAGSADAVDVDGSVVADVDAAVDPLDVGAARTSDADGEGGSADADGSSAATECAVGDAVGTCRHLSDCGVGEIAVEGFCPDGPRTRCCLADAWAGCSAEAAPGACLARASCGGQAWRAVAGLCPGPSDVQCCRLAAAPPPCDPDAAPRPNEGLVEAPGHPGCPPGMVGVTAELCVDRFEAALVRDDAPEMSVTPYHHPGALPVRAVSVRWAVPQGYVDRGVARAACERANKRLCTSAEWLRACRGEAGWTYPYGPTREDGRCNDARAIHPAIETFGTSAPWIWSELGHPCINQLAAGLTLTGERGGCRTSEGVHDMMGNLHEWVDDGGGVFRGGFYADTALNGPGCLYATTAHGPTHRDYSTGFRCCVDRAR